MSGKVGLALGSGSAKGFAHLGVLQALEEHKIPIDMIAGSSVGAIVGAVYSVGCDMDMFGKFISATNNRSVFDMTTPTKGGLLKGNRLQEMIRIFTHDKNFDQTNIPFMCVAVDMETGERLVFKEGKMHECIRASIAIPGIFTPYRVNEHYCIDGGVLERVPCQPLKDEGAEVIIGVDVGYRGQVRYMNKVSPQNTLKRCIDIMQWSITQQRTQIADIMLCPDVTFMKGFSTEYTMDAIAEGKRVAEEAIPSIIALLAEKGIPLKEE